MELSIRFNKDSLPIFVFFLILIKVCYVAFMTFFVDVSNTNEDLIFYSRFIADNFAWMPMMIFFVYFYLYRVGKVSNIGLKNATLSALLAIIPKFVIIGILIYTYLSANFFILIYYILELLTWLFLGMYLISYWNEKFRISDKEKRHRSHSHHYHHRDLTSKGSVLGKVAGESEPRYFEDSSRGSHGHHHSHGEHSSHHSHGEHSHHHHHHHHHHSSDESRYEDVDDSREQHDEE